MNHQTQKQEREHFFGQAKLVAAVTMVSRVFGMFRDMALTALGADRSTGAFVLAFQIPNLMRRLFGEGALSGAFVPVLTSTQQNGGPESAGRLLANALGLLAVFLSVLTVLVLAGLWVWHIFWPGGWDRQLLVGLVSVMMPFVITICLLALGSAALNCRGHFMYPAAAPILLNIFIIAAATLAWRFVGKENIHGQLYVIAGSVIVAGIVQLAAVLWLLRRSGFPVLPRLRPIEPGIKPMLKLMAPVALGMGFLQISPLFDSLVIWLLSITPDEQTISILGHVFQRPLSEGAQVHVYAAQRLYQLPMGVLAISLGVAVFPLLSRYAARGETQNLRQSVTRALRLSSMEGLACGAGLWMLARPITAVIFLRGKYTAADVDASAGVLQMYVLGMWAYCTHQILTKAFFAIKQPRVPMQVSCILMVVNMVLVLTMVWIPALGPRSFGLSTTLTALASVTVLIVVLRRRLGRLGGRELLGSLLRSMCACAAMVLAIGALMQALHRFGDLAVVAVCIPAGAAVFFAVAALLRMQELGEVAGPLLRRFRRGAQQANETEIPRV